MKDERAKSKEQREYPYPRRYRLKPVLLFFSDDTHASALSFLFPLSSLLFALCSSFACLNLKKTYYPLKLIILNS